MSTKAKLTIWIQIKKNRGESPTLGSLVSMSVNCSQLNFEPVASNNLCTSLRKTTLVASQLLIVYFKRLAVIKSVLNVNSFKQDYALYKLFRLLHSLSTYRLVSACWDLKSLETVCFCLETLDCKLTLNFYIAF